MNPPRRLVLWIIARMRDATMTGAGSWGSAAALFGYAAALNGWSLWSGERIAARQGVGLALAIGGLVGLLWPEVSAPPAGSAALMIAAIAAVMLLGESITLRLVASSAAILGGIALVVLARRRA